MDGSWWALGLPILPLAVLGVMEIIPMWAVFLLIFAHFGLMFLNLDLLPYSCTLIYIVSLVLIFLHIRDLGDALAFAVLVLLFIGDIFRTISHTRELIEDRRERKRKEER